MKITIENTDKIVDLPPTLRQARVWEGVTEGGVRCFILIARLAVHKDDDNTLFEKELTEHTPKRFPDSFDMRQIL